ncbi:MAG TPA: hypothetical protein VHV10_04400, partial [Ktedonobacteraceae bacterium]|nr:hypothetical protein [Ktedonobacteraceae bacterium]
MTAATVDKHPAEAGAAAVVAAKERRALFQAKAVTAQAEKTIAGLTGGDDATQTDAVHRVLEGGLDGAAEGTIDAIYNQGGLVAVVRYAESRIQVKEAVVRADQTARQMAVQRGLPETPANVGDPTQATEGQAAARSVRDRAQAIRDRNEGNPNTQDIQSAEEVAPGAKQAITDAVKQVDIIQDLARADHEITAQMNARTATAERCAAAEAEIADLIKKAPNQEDAQEVLKASREVAIRFQAAELAAESARITQSARGRGDVAQKNAANAARRRVTNTPDLAAAVRYAESLAQIAKAVRELGQADAQAVNKAALNAQTENVGDPFAQDIEAAMAAARAAVPLNIAGDSPEIAALKAGQAVTDASDQPYAIKEYHGDRDEEYKMAIKAARETRVAQKIRIFKDGEAVEKAGAIASNRVKGSASQASQKLMQQVATAQVLKLEQDRDPDRAIQRTGLDTVKESLSQASRKLMQRVTTAQVPELEQVRDPEQVSRGLLDTAKSEADKNVEKHAKNIARLLYGNNASNIIERNAYVENAKSTFKSIVHNTERMSWLRGEDRIAQHAAIAEAVTSYAAYLTELTSATSIASRDAAAIATLAGRNAKSYARETAKAVLLRADIARHDAALEGKSPIDQYAAAAAGARRFAQVQVELGRSAKAAAKAAEDRARAE